MPLSWDFSIFECLPSTQDLLKEKAQEGAMEGLVIQAASQTKGRGRQGREWHSQEGNLYLSFLLKPNCSVQDIGQISLLIGWALGRSISEFIQKPESLSLKWPNDLLLEGRKCAGILLESSLDCTGRIEWLAVGLGVNVSAVPEKMSGNIGASLNDYATQPIDLALFRESLFIHLEACYTLWQEQGFAPIREGWLAMAHDFGAPVTVKITPQDIRSGAFEGVDGRGALLIRTDKKEAVETITAGDVYLCF